MGKSLLLRMGRKAQKKMIGRRGLSYLNSDFVASLLRLFSQKVDWNQNAKGLVCLDKWFLNFIHSVVIAMSKIECTV